MMKSFFGNGTRYQETPKLSAEKTAFLVTTILMQFTWKLEVFALLMLQNINMPTKTRSGVIRLHCHFISLHCAT